MKRMEDIRLPKKIYDYIAKGGGEWKDPNLDTEYSPNNERTRIGRQNLLDEWSVSINS